MKSNVSKVDRIIRVVFAVAIAVLYYTGQFTGTYAIVALILAVVFAGTAFINFCPLYYALGISTKKTSAAERVD